MTKQEEIIKWLELSPFSFHCVIIRGLSKSFIDMLHSKLAQLIEENRREFDQKDA